MGVAVGEGFSAGGFVAEGTGGGAFSGTTLRVGSGKAGALRLLLPLPFSLEFEFVLLFAFASGVKSSVAAGEAATLALGLAFAGGVIDPPDGIPSSPLPVAGCAGCTGWLLGSAASDGTTCWLVLASPGVEFLVIAYITANTTSNPITDGISTFKGLKPAAAGAGGGIWPDTVTTTGSRR